MQNWVNPKSVPSCLSLNLTTCTMRDFALAGQQSNHLILALFILKNARVLETLSILALSSCPWASSACQLLMYRC
ncbi:putative FBD domain-containing protein [Medicago truncatula]|uniref:Putative FBD domain-containing protein n=1 Tax=Medicago truncatula TaxID=3880 RepID=A0A396J157_MEDTR|nr:putative FBD domain-containing protein [Medicago truncatula]